MFKFFFAKVVYFPNSKNISKFQLSSTFKNVLSFCQSYIHSNTVKTFLSFTKHANVRSTNVQKCSKILSKFLASNAVKDSLNIAQTEIFGIHKWSSMFPMLLKFKSVSRILNSSRFTSNVHIRVSLPQSLQYPLFTSGLAGARSTGSTVPWST